MNTATRYVRKAVIIEAIQYTGLNAQEIRDAWRPAPHVWTNRTSLHPNVNELAIQTSADGIVTAGPGDYVVRTRTGYTRIAKSVFEYDHEELQAVELRIAKTNAADLKLINDAWYNAQHGNVRTDRIDVFEFGDFCTMLQTRPNVHTALLKYLQQNAPT